MQKFKSQYIVKEKDKKTGAILPIKECEDLLEYFLNLALVAKRRHEPAITFGELNERLRKNGSVQ